LTLGPSNLSLSISPSSALPPPVSLKRLFTIPLSHVGFRYQNRFLSPPYVDPGTGGVVEGG
jgi:hypothetical protein